MRAMVFQQYGGPEVLTAADLPEPVPGPGEVRVRVAATAVNPADWRLRSGRFRFLLRVRLPFVPGNDLAGVVDAVGEEVSGVRVGDRVLGLTATKAGGACAESVVLPESQVAVLAPDVPLTSAAAVPLVGSTALQALRDRAGLAPGDRVLVHGAAGGVGHLAVQVAHALGGRVTAVAGDGSQEVLTSLGAERVVTRGSADERALGGEHDVVLDAVDGLSVRRMTQLLRPGGTAVSVNPGAGVRHPDLLAPLRGGRRIRSVLVRPVAADLRQLAAWLADGTIRPQVEQAFDLGRLADAHVRSESGRVRGKLVVVVDPRLASEAHRTPDAAPGSR